MRSMPARCHHALLRRASHHRRPIGGGASGVRSQPERHRAASRKYNVPRSRKVDRASAIRFLAPRAAPRRSRRRPTEARTLVPSPAGRAVRSVAGAKDVGYRRVSAHRTPLGAWADKPIGGIDAPESTVHTRGRGRGACRDSWRRRRRRRDSEPIHIALADLPEVETLFFLVGLARGEKGSITSSPSSMARSSRSRRSSPARPTSASARRTR